MKGWSLIIFLVVCFDTSAQKFSSDEWHNGRIILTSNDTIVGKVRYNLESNTVIVNPARSKEQYAFNAQKLIYFDFTDALTGTFRQFIILPFDINNNNYEIPVFFEIVQEGQLSLLTRERIEKVVDNYSGYRSFSTDRLVQDYYFLKENGKIIKFDGKKRSLKYIFEPYYTEVREYIRERNLKLDRMTDLSRIVSYYNQLKLATE